MVLGGLGRWWVVMLDRRAILATEEAVREELVGRGHPWVGMLVRRAILATV